MGTGKTQLLNKLFDEYPEQMKRVLFISCRQSLANELESVFIEKEVANYMAGEYLNKRMVCSIESINNLIESYEKDESIYLFDEGEKEFRCKYDMIIFDEAESNLYQYESMTVKDKHKSFSSLCQIISNSTKCLFMDADISTRTIDYARNFGDYIYINNEHKGKPLKFKFIDDEKEFNKLYHESITSGKKIAMPSMSQKKILFYYRKYGKNIDKTFKKKILERL
jgi:hypothetical protein